MFFTYGQNNTGGSFDEDATAGISQYVLIEADNHIEANMVAKSIGLYFDGYGDCECCGNRWYPVWEGDGTDLPEVYGTYYLDYEPMLNWVSIPSIYVHYKDGSIATSNV